MTAMRTDLRFEPFRPLQGDPTTERSEYQVIDPVAGVESGTIEFQISASPAGMIDLSQSYVLSRLTMKQTTDYAAKPVAALVNGDATPETLKVALLATTADPDVAAPRPIRPWEEDDAPGECFSDAIWSLVEFYINGVNVSDSAPGLYPYASYFRNALTKNQQWASGGIIHYASARAGHESAPLSNQDVGIGEDEFLYSWKQMKAKLMATPAGYGAENMGYAFSDKAYGSTGAAANCLRCLLLPSTTAGASYGVRPVWEVAER